MLDVEVVVLHVGKHHAGQPELGLEGLAILIRGEEFGVFAHDPIPLGSDGLHGTGEVLPGLELDDVIVNEVEGNLDVLNPDLVLVVETRSRGEVEPGLR